MPGVQIITTSRTPWSCGDDFLKIRLRPLNEADIRGYLERVGVDMPAPGDNIWKVINYPLMLTLYAHIEAVQKRVMGGLSTGVLARENLVWHPMNKAGDIIWNYLQKELARCAEEMGDNPDPNIEDYAVAILHTAPYAAWRMSRKDAFSLPLTEKDKVVNEDDMSFSSIVRESLFCLRDQADWPDQLEQIVDGDGISESKTGRWINLAGQRDSKEIFEKTERIAKILLNEVNLFRIQESTGKDKSLSRKKNKKRVQMMHQQFRDGLAAIWLCQRIETMEVPAILENGIFKNTGDKYALPLCCRDRIGRYVLKFAAEIMDEDTAERFWEVGRNYQPSDVKFAYIMLNLMSERSLKDGIHQNDFSELDFSGMDLSDISLFLYRVEGCMKLKLPHKSELGRMAGTGISLRTFMSPGHSGVVNSVAVTSDGKRAVSGGDDNAVRVWDLESMTCEKVLEGHSGWAQSVAVTGDGKRAVSGGDDNAVRVWDLESMTCEKVLEGHSGLVLSAAVTGNGKRAVSGGSDGTVRVWDLESMTCEKVLGGHSGSVRSVAVTGDGKRAVSGGDDNAVRVWDLKTMTCEKVLEGHSDSVRSVAVTGDGKRAVSGGDDGTVRVWDLESMTCEKVLWGHSGWVLSVAVIGDGKRAVSVGDDNAVRVWDLKTMTCEKVLEGHSGFVQSVAVTGDGKRAVSVGSDNTVRVWDMEKETWIMVLKPLPGIDIIQIDLSEAVIDSEEDREILRQNGALV